MTNRPKQIGTKFETDTARYLTVSGIAAERIALHGTEDQGDVVHPGLTFECKGGHAAETASDEQIRIWLVETERERGHRGADHGVLILKRKGKGLASAGQWWAILTGRSFVELACHLDDWRGDDIYGESVPPVRLLLADAVTLLRRAGYGDPLP